MMPENPEERHGEPANGPDRFDAEAVRRILHRAVEEQERLDSERPDSYSLEELEEIATETGISPEAVRAALEAYRDQSPPGAEAPAATHEEGPRGLIAWLEHQLPATWSRRAKRAVLIGIGVGLFALLLSLPGVGPIVIWVTALTLLALILLLLFGLAS
jgi:hypothetical protein